MSLRPRAVLVHRRSAFDDLLAAHGTVQHAGFFLQQRGRSVDELQSQHELLTRALSATRRSIPKQWRQAEVERDDLSRFIFGPEDIVVVVGQDGLVANAAKYVDAQPVVGVNPEPGRNPGVLVNHSVEDVAGVLDSVISGRAGFEQRTLVEATTDGGQRLRALNELFVGHASHQSARYRVEDQNGNHERQSSSGLLIGTGTGATGWLRSVWQERHSRLALPRPTGLEVCWFVREAWPSPATGTSMTEGQLADGDRLVVVAEGDLVCFGDGIEKDRITLTWGQRLEIGRSSRPMHLVSSTHQDTQ